MDIILNSHKNLMSFVIFAGLCSFWPFLAGYDRTVLENSILRRSLNEGAGGAYVHSCTVMVSLWLPLCLDFILDLIQRYQRKSNNKDDSIDDLERGVLLTGLIASPILGYLDLHYEHLTLLWFCMTRFQIIMVLCTLRVSFTRFDREIWPPWMTWLGVVCMTVAVNLTTYTSCMGDDTGPLTVLSTLLKALSMVGLAIPSCRWLVRTVMTIRRSHQEQKIEKKENFDPRIAVKKRSSSGRILPPITIPITRGSSFHQGKNWLLDLLSRGVGFGAHRKSSTSMPYDQGDSTRDTEKTHFNVDHLIFPALYISVGTISYVIITIMLMVLVSADKFTPVLLVLYNASFIILELMLLIYYLRKIKFESVYHLVALMDQKKSYLRYIRYYLVGHFGRETFPHVFVVFSSFEEEVHFCISASLDCFLPLNLIHPLLSTYHPLTITDSISLSPCFCAVTN